MKRLDKGFRFYSSALIYSLQLQQSNTTNGVSTAPKIVSNQTDSHWVASHQELW